MADSPIDEYTQDEEEALSRNVEAVEAEIERGDFRTERLCPDLARMIHHRIFGGVRRHAGRSRDAGFGQEHIIVLGRRSPHRRDVPSSLDKVLERAERDLRSVTPGDLEQALAAAVALHVDLVKLQPFHDGNKRTSRALLNIALTRAGLSPVAFTVPRKEYMDALLLAIDGTSEPFQNMVLVLLVQQLRAADQP